MREWLMARGYELAASSDITLTDKYAVDGGAVVLDAAAALWRECQRLQAELAEAKR